jgi:hypothetical protein
MIVSSTARVIRVTKARRNMLVVALGLKGHKNRLCRPSVPFDQKVFKFPSVVELTKKGITVI